MQTIDAYLFGATVFRYATIFGASFSRLAFMEALAAGVRDEPFPLESILLATRDKYPDLRFGRRQVAALQRDTEAPYLDDEEARWDPRRLLGDTNAGLLLSIAQDIDIDHVRPLDIDHIYATALANRMHAADNKKAHHPQRWWVNTIGNMWLLDAGTNRALQDRKPSKKFKLLEGWLGATPQVHRVWPLAMWSITQSEVQRFKKVDAAIDRDVNGTMSEFVDLVASRADRLLDKPFEMLPEAKLFAGDSGLQFPDQWRPTDALPSELAERLALTEVAERMGKPSDRPPPIGSPGAPGERRPILDVPRRPGWPTGWRKEFAYVDFRGERWEERNIKTVYNRIFKWLWANRRDDLLRWDKQQVENSDYDVGLIAGPGRVGRWDRLDDEHYLQMGLFYQYLVRSVQEVLEALDLADGVYVVYATSGAWRDG